MLTGLALTWRPFPHEGGISTVLQYLQSGLPSHEIRLDIVSLAAPCRSKRLRLNRGLATVLGRRTCQADLEPLLEAAARWLAWRLVKTPLSGWDFVSCQDVFSLESLHRACDLLHLKGDGLPPVVLTVHGYAAYESASEGWAHGQRDIDYLLGLEKEAYEQAESIVAVDESIATHISSLAPTQTRRPTVIQNCVPDSFGNDTIDMSYSDARQRCGLPERTCIFLVPRRLTAKNGVLVPVSAFGGLVTSDEWLLVYAGSGDLRESIQRTAARAHIDARVRMLGSVPHDEMPLLYRAADVVLIPSVPSAGVVEATSLSAIEACACGTAVIASDIGGLHELFSAGDGPVLLPAGDERVWREECQRLIHDPVAVRDLGDRCRDWYRKRSDAASWAGKYAQVFCAAVAASRRSN